jgi:hypothetical protein
MRPAIKPPQSSKEGLELALAYQKRHHEMCDVLDTLLRKRYARGLSPSDLIELELLAEKAFAVFMEAKAAMSRLRADTLYKRCSLEGALKASAHVYAYHRHGAEACEDGQDDPLITEASRTMLDIRRVREWRDEGLTPHEIMDLLDAIDDQRYRKAMESSDAVLARLASYQDELKSLVDSRSGSESGLEADRDEEELQDILELEEVLDDFPLGDTEISGHEFSAELLRKRNKWITDRLIEYRLAEAEELKEEWGVDDENYFDSDQGGLGSYALVFGADRQARRKQALAKWRSAKRDQGRR